MICVMVVGIVSRFVDRVLLSSAIVLRLSILVVVFARSVSIMISWSINIPRQLARTLRPSKARGLLLVSRAVLVHRSSLCRVVEPRVVLFVPVIRVDVQA